MNLMIIAGKPRPMPEICVPAKPLGVDGTEPEPGDEVSFKVEGKVSRAENGHLYVKPSSINGQPVAAEEKPTDQDAEMERMAKEADDKEAV